MTQKIVFWGVCILLLFLPLPLGSVLEWATFAFEAGVIILVLVHVLGPAIERKWGAPGRKPGPGNGDDRHGPKRRLPPVFKVLAAVYFSFSIFQLLPLPPSVLRFLSPKTWEVLAGLADKGVSSRSAGSWHALAFDPSASLGKLILILCIGAFGFLVLRSVRSKREMETMVLVILAGGLFQAFYGMAETFSGHEMIFGIKKRSFGAVSGTFFNRNHFAGFMEMAFSLSLGYVLVKARYFMMEKGLTLRERILWFSQEKLQWTFLYGLGAVFMGTALIFSRSRSGVMIFLLLVILAVVLAGGWRDISGRSEDLPGTSGRRSDGAMRRAGTGKAVRLVAAVIIAVSAWIGLGPILERFATTDIGEEIRGVFYRDTMDMIRDHPFFGMGQGNFVNAYAMYEKVDDGYKLSYAHNDFLEFVAENGLISGLCLLGLAAGMAAVIALRWRRRRDNFAKGIGLGCLLALAAILVHALTDFNLQITANAAYYAAIAALGFNVVTRRGARHDRGKEDPGKGEMGARAGLENGEGPDAAKRMRFGRAAVIVLALAALSISFRDLQVYRYRQAYRKARSTVRSVESGFGSLEPLLLKAVNSSVRAGYKIDLARLYGEMARVAVQKGEDEERDAWCDKAIGTYKEALRADPIDAFAYYETGMVYLMINYPLMTYMDRAESYLRAALSLKPADRFLNLNVVFLHMTWWPELDEETRSYTAGLFRRMIGTDPNFGKKLRKRWAQAYGNTRLENFESALADLVSAQSVPSNGAGS